MRAALAECISLRVWQQISTAPPGRDLELAVIDGDGVHALVFPCKRQLDGWIKSETGERVVVHPTHWRDWSERNRSEQSHSAQHPPDGDRQ
jgi:hypothetical protein